MKTISKDAKKILEQYKQNDKYTIIKIYYGKNAFNKAKKLFFLNKENKEFANKWGKQWTNYQKYHSVLFVFLRPLRKNIHVHFKYIIGSGNSLSVLGERVRNYDKGIQILSQL